MLRRTYPLRPVTPRRHPNRPPLPLQGTGASAPTAPASTRADRTGVDARQRGWYWHWNGIVTQYAPLIGLKGVGLLNSYTVWTDRREQSPTRGYAFPSQQSEADFYGEDRAELITINKILVALDLIEIRKEMVQRTDPQGRRWKVPHNLYRVKDRPEGIELRTEDVLRVAELASRDAAVFRYVKRVFSSRFTPIDRDNIWHRILAEVAGDPTWQELSEKTARIEARASARSRAGHKARGKQPAEAAERGPSTPLMTTGHSDHVTLVIMEQPDSGLAEAQTSDAQTNSGLGSQSSAVASGNSGSEPDVDPINTGSQGGDVSSAEATNNGPPSVVAPGNATYYQEVSTTTTTTSNASDADGDGSDSGNEAASDIFTASDEQGEAPHPPVAGSHGLDDGTGTLHAGAESGAQPAGSPPVQRSLADPAANGPLVDPGPLVVSLYEAANNRRSSPLERALLGELERDFSEAAARCGESGSDWVAAALREAVSSGSTFVAPKRIAEILKRWATLGARPGHEPSETSPLAAGALGNDDRVRLPRGRSATRLWAQVLADLSSVLDEESRQRLLGGSRISGYREGAVEIEVAPEVVSKLSAEYRPLLQRNLERHLGRPVTVLVRPAAEAEHEPPVEASLPTVAVIISSADAEQGRQLWRAVLSEVRQSTGGDDLARLRDAVPLGQDADGHIVIGAPTAIAARLIDGRCRRSVESALMALLGARVTVKVARPGNWLIDDERAGEER